LAYDLDDEMGGRERDIALAYLGHARKVALKLDLEEAYAGRSPHTIDRQRVRDVLEAAGKEEREALAASEQIAVLRDQIYPTQRDLVDALLDTRLDEEERAARIAAIELFDAMEGWGTDEAAIERVVGRADSEEERQRIRDAFEAYAGQRGWNQTLDEALEDDLSGSELVLMKELASVERDESAVAIARMVRAADDLAPPGGLDRQLQGGMGNAGWNGGLRALGHAQKRTILAALDDEGFAAQIRQAQASPNPSQAVAALREQRKRQLGQALSRATGGAHDDIEQFLDQELGPSDVTYREICAGVTRDGVTITPDMIRAGKVPGGGYINLARMVAQVKVEDGRAPRDLLVKYALDDELGVDKATLEQALSRGGGPLPQAELAALICTFRAHWGEDLVATEGESGTTELDYLRRLPRAEAERRLKGSRAMLLGGTPGERIVHFFSPGGKVEREVGGRAWQRVRVLLCGKPRSPIESRYVALLEGANAKSGELDWLAGRAEEDLDRDIGTMEERYGALRGDQRTRSYGDLMLGARDGEAASSAWLSDTALGVKEGAEDVHTTAKIMAENKDAAVDKVTMVGEIAAAIAVTLLTCGASLAVIGASLALRAALAAKIASAAAATLGRRAALGEAYSGEEMARDIAAGVVEIAITGAKAKLAVSASKATSKLGVEIAKKVLEDQVEALPGLIRSSGEEDRPGFVHNLAAVAGGALVERRLGNAAGELSKQMIKSIDHHDDEIDRTDLAKSLIQDGAPLVRMNR
ncbi:MAG TPA: hypothetical protein VKZ63_08595, partial [Kofleriaceae bacterium]|nr:hypothetical protein [Kofleriaceae bacterium]